MLAAQTFQSVEIEANWQLSLLDVIFFSIYLFELILKFYAWRLRYFKNSWNTFDFLVVLASTNKHRRLLINLVVRALRARRVLRFANDTLSAQLTDHRHDHTSINTGAR